jgi:mRNA interferase HigB
VGLRLREFWEKWPDARLALSAWYKVADKASWTSPQDVRQSFRHADGISLNCGIEATVFNVGGNKYRLITRIDYSKYRIYVKLVLTHKQYDTDKWKAQLCRE